MKRRNIVILVLVIVIGAAAAAAGVWYRREQVPVITAEVIKTRDLEAVVSSSGKIQPKRLVNISADTPGRVVNLAVNEGDRVTRGQFLLQIDPKSLRTRVDGGAASLQAAEASLDQMRQTVETSRVQLQQAQQNLARQRELSQQLLTTREALERAENDLKAAESSLREREKQINAQDARISQERATLESARYDLSKVRIESPIDGIVTRRNIQEGETAVVGTMNNAGTVLLTLADMSVIQAEVEVDETNMPSVAIGQPAKVTIDALPDRSFKGRVTEIGNSPIQPVAGAAASASRQATNFKVVVVIDDDIPDVRPGFTCTADVTTATRQGRHGGADSRRGRSRADLRRQWPDGPDAARSEPEVWAASSRPRSPRSCSRARRGKRPKGSSSSGRARSSMCRSRWASPATAISRCSRDSSRAIRWSLDRTTRCAACATAIRSRSKRRHPARRTISGILYRP